MQLNRRATENLLVGATLVIAAGMALILGAGFALARGHDLSLIYRTREYPATLVMCHDGDTCTFDVQLGFGTTIRQDFRLCDVYAPEIHQPGGGRAREALEELTMRGRVLLQVAQKSRCKDPNRCEQTAQSRVMSYWTVDGRDVGKELVMRGVARWYRPGEERCGRTR